MPWAAGVKKVEVAIGLIIAGNQILVASRENDPYIGTVWEFPGGKLEPGENSRDALIRELQEEIAIEVVTADYLLSMPYQYPQMEVVLHAWRVHEFLGEPRGCEGQALKWVNHPTLLQLKMPLANAALLQLFKSDNNII